MLIAPYHRGPEEGAMGTLGAEVGANFIGYVAARPP
jgi:hypothetical protein